MQIKFTSKGNTLIASIAGELDHHYAEYARHKMDGEIVKSTTKNLIFDFSRLSFMDSSGIGVIIGRYKSIQQLSGKVAIVCDNPQIRRILEMSGIQKIIPVYEKLGDATGSVA